MYIYTYIHNYICTYIHTYADIHMYISIYIHYLEPTTRVLALTSFDPAEMVAGLASADPEGGDAAPRRAELVM